MSDPARPSCPQSAGSVTCRECADFLMDYLDGLLPQEEHLKFQSHIQRCPGCLIYLENYRKTAAMTARLGACHTPNAQVPRRLVDAILAVRKKDC